MHGLGTLAHSHILPSPIHHAHPHEVIQNPIGENSQITSLELPHNTDSVPPQAVVKVTLIEYIIGPTLLIEPLLPWEDHPMKHPGVNLANC